MESVQKAKTRRKRKENNPPEGDSFEKAVDNHMKSTLTFDNKQICFATEETDYDQPMACITYPYNDSGFGRVWAAYGPHAVLHPQIAGGTSTRVPLPREPSADEPIYVNPKQYHGILRRRQLRAKLEAQNKLVKVRKPYLHESRHLHAMKRARGSGGRFLNTKQLQQQSRTASTANGANATSSTSLLLGGATSRERTLPALQTITSEENNRKAGAYAPAMANDDAFQHQAHCLSFLGWFGQASMEGAASGMRSGTKQRVPVMR